MDKPREFWIEVKSFSSEILAAYYEKPDETTYRIAKDVIHVVEHGVYEKLKVENEIECQRSQVRGESLLTATREIERLKAENEQLNTLLIVADSATGVMHQATKIKEQAREIDRLRIALNSVMPYLKRSNDSPEPIYAVFIPAAQQLRNAAEAMEKKDSIIYMARQVLASIKK